ncbi:signal peptidase complex catalytic subunit SEC11A isoform X1 [Sylvia atricapilla]|uniref:signal peptidase complex catalytic subunit SEC11A isoform X1 n=1 Tax=Sylvia atricapilla TaxID=48155 RepID=UPI003395B40A
MLSLDFLDDVRRMNKRQLYYQVLNFGMIVSSALMIWKGLMVVTGSESPIVVVLSGSMEPAFHRGDLLFLTNRIEDPIRVGEIVVFRIEGREIPIVHRVLKIHEKQNGDIKFLTKGDNNAVDDRGLYKQGQHWLEKKDVVGRARGFVPYIGIVTILMNDYPKFKVRSLLFPACFSHPSYNSSMRTWAEPCALHICCCRCQCELLYLLCSLFQYAVLFLLGLFVLVHRE